MACSSAVWATFCLFGLSNLVFGWASSQAPLRANDNLRPDILTGLYENDYRELPSKIAIHDTFGDINWSWTKDDISDQNDIPDALRTCIETGWVVTAVKWAHGGRSVLAIYQSAVIIVNHHPDETSDKKLTFGMCLDYPGGKGMTNAHDVELLPNNTLAIAANVDYKGSIRLFESTGFVPYPKPVQVLNSLPAAHSLLWDDEEGLLWAVGNDKPPNGSDGPARALLSAYRVEKSQDPIRKFPINNKPLSLNPMWENDGYKDWWDGAHDLAPSPNERKLLITTDRDIHVFDIENQTFTHGSDVVEKYLSGFFPELHAGERIGTDGVDYWRSDVKSISMNGAGEVIYVQAWWHDSFGDNVKFLVDGRWRGEIGLESRLQWVYKSKWFSSIPGWPSA